ncbi:hypothetical protein NQ318_012660 [Aromia moschata]|uniref:Uncharacterized protein n=1 Tax=Aromia moschata TaxID=1265417 RepID=A0AAV8X7V6_9CUCU|nr:hypothetical protein NQ318_012660 [Aromia moschata]
MSVLESDESSLDHRSTYSTSAEIKCVGRNSRKQNIGPFFFEETLTREIYLEFLQNDLVPALARVAAALNLNVSTNFEAL